MPVLNRQATELIVDRAAETIVRDGMILRSTVYRAADGRPRPVLLVRNPYGEPMARTIPVNPFLDAGFAVVVQDCRGCGASDGDFEPFVAESDDSVDTIEWCAAQEWSTGKVVTYGASYSGMVQLAAAVQRPSALVGMIPIVAPADYHGGVAYRDGAFQLGQLSGWYTLKSIQTLIHRTASGQNVGHLFAQAAKRAADPAAALRELPLTESTLLSEVLDSWQTWLVAEERDEYWQGFSYQDSRREIEVAGLHVGGWFDLFLGGTLDNFIEISTGASSQSARASQQLIIGPWSHTDQSGTVGELSFGAGASALALGLESIETAFARAAVDADETNSVTPCVRIFVMGANVWRDEQSWPLARAVTTPWYLHPDGTLSAVAPEQPEASATRYVADPGDPVPTVGGQTLMTGGLNGGVEWMPGPRDQRSVESHPGVVSFTSAVLAEDLEVTGPISMTLFASSTASDTDFLARLVDVWPDGRAMSVVDGIVRARARARARARHGDGTASSPLSAGEIVEYTIDLWATSQLFRAGHAIRVDVSSSSFPAFDRNPGNGVGVAAARESDFQVAEQRIFHDAQHPSRMLLPVVPG